MNVELTKLSSRGQVVIPRLIREKLGLKSGTPLALMEKGDTILMRRVEMPQFKDFDKMVSESRKFARKNNITPRKLEETISGIRNRK